MKWGLAVACLRVYMFNPLWPNDAMILVHIGSGNGLLPDGTTKPLPQPMLIIMN